MLALREATGKIENYGARKYMASFITVTCRLFRSSAPSSLRYCGIVHHYARIVRNINLASVNKIVKRLHVQ